MSAVGGASDRELTRESFVVRKGTDEETTGYVTTADADGPTAVVVGGVHGNEVAGYVAAGQIADWEIDAGTLVTIPEADAIAVEAETRTGSDGVDLNRQFPGGSEPKTALARAIWDVVESYDPDVVIDLHESTGVYAGDPVDGVGQAIFHSDGRDVAETASHATEYVTRNDVDDPALAFETGPFSAPDTEPSGLLVHKAARDLGADAFLVETVSTDVDLETRVEWHSVIVEQLLPDEMLLEAQTSGVSDDEPADDEPADDEPADDEPADDESADEDDEPADDEPADDEPADDKSADEDDEPADEDETTESDLPVASIEPCPATVDELSLESGQTLELDASGSHAPDGDIVAYEWDVGDTGQFDETGATIDVTVDSNGCDTVVLRVADDDGATDTDSITLSAN